MYGTTLLDETAGVVSKGSAKRQILISDDTDMQIRMWYLILVLGAHDGVQRIVFDPALGDQSLRCVKPEEDYYMPAPPKSNRLYLKWLALQLICRSLRTAEIAWAFLSLSPFKVRGEIVVQHGSSVDFWVAAVSKRNVTFELVSSRQA